MDPITSARGAIIACLATVLLALGISGCPRPSASTPDGPLPEQTGAPQATATDLTLQYARNFTVESRDGFRVVKIIEPWRGAGTGFEYALVPADAPAPEGFKPEQIVRVPLETVVAMSTTQLPMLKALGCLDRLVAVADGKTPCTEEVVAAIKSGEVAVVGEGQSVNLEKLVELSPSAILDSALGDPQYDTYPKLLEGGLRVVIDGSYMEGTPLGRAEWIKLLGLLLGREAEAEAVFSSIADEYNALAQRVKATGDRPTVLAGMQFRGTWYVPGGASYMAGLFADAGAEYLWADDDTAASIPLDFEAVLAKAQDAQFWLNPETCTTMQQIAAADRRHKLFRAYREGNVYNHSKRMNQTGGDDYWETGIANPHRILADLVAIFHPELLPDHELIWYEMLP
jgi:iron complex transport system substrate-binding protein